MIKRYLVGILAVAILVGGVSAPVFSHALTLPDVQAQIQALLQQIENLKAQILKLQATPTPSPVYGSQQKVCALLQRSLSQGYAGDDVRELQEFMAAEGYFSGAATGYYGPKTAAAVAQWQAREGLSPVGIFGPKSLERLKIWCGGAMQQERFTASPSHGAAPLTVTFSTWLSGFRPGNISYIIDFGDGSQENATPCPAPADACTGPGENKHTYTQNGTYTAVLYKIVDPCYGNMYCRAAVMREAVAKAQVTVGGDVACTMEYAPVCGAKPVVCITAPCNPVPTTYSNSCMMKADGATLLYPGQCTETTDPSANPQCKSWYDGCNTCSRETPGGIAACTLKYCVQHEKPYCKAYFGDNGAPSISSFSGPTTLRIGETGTWTIKASDPENQSLTYKVTWGDEKWYNSVPAALSGAQAFVQTTTFTHAYDSAGEYTVTIVVRDASGKEAKTSTTVRVSQSLACTKEYKPVCGQPAFSCPPGMYCAQVMPAPQTYSNECMMRAAGATLIHEGSCSSPVACPADAMQCPNGQWVGRSGPNCQFICS